MVDRIPVRIPLDIFKIVIHCGLALWSGIVLW